MHIGGRWGARPAVAAVRRGACRLTRAPAFGVAAIAPLVFASAVGGAAPVFPGRTAPVHAVITPVAAVAASGIDLSGPVVIAMKRPPTSFRVAVATISAPPPPMIVNSPGALGIPAMALSAYRNAELKMAAAAPGCGVSWNLLAGIGRIESMHANGGATDARGTAIQPIYGPTLDGTLPGNEIIIQSSVGNRVTYARAMGPMQFLPGTWARYATDGDDDGVADPQNLFDSTLAAARYLCSGGLNLRDPAQVMAALLLRWMAPDPSAPMPGCTLICIGSHGPPVGAPPFPPTAPPPPFLPAAPPPPDPLAGPPGDAGLAPPAPAPAG